MSKYIYNDWDEDVLTPIKSKKKKSVKKSSHKHIYNEFIGEYIYDDNTPNYVLAKKCEICGKTVVVNHFLTVKIPNSCLVRLFPSINEVKEMYPNLKIEPIK